MGRLFRTPRWLVERNRTRTFTDLETSNRATCEPTNPLAPVTSVVIDSRVATSAASMYRPGSNWLPARQRVHIPHAPCSPGNADRVHGRIAPRVFFRSTL